MSARVRAALLVCMAVAALHIAYFGSWIVEDSAISFAYARHLVQGDGLVPFTGGERVEGYSNPTWVAVEALGLLVGAQPFWTVKFAAMVLAALTVPLVYRLGARAAPERAQEAGLFSAVAFAVDSGVGIFGAAGLENPLFSLLLALGWVWGAEEADDARRWPRSALVWMLLAVTRPEGIVYAAIGGLFALIAAWRSGRGYRGIAAWLALFWTPFLAYHAARYAYFAWPFPMTFYAKVRGPAGWLDWGAPGWRYVHDWFVQARRVPFLVPWALAAVGPRAWTEPRASQVLAAGLGVVAFVLFTQGGAIVPVAIGVAAVALGVAASVGEGWIVRGPAWWSLVVGFAFAVQAQGDWMGGFRWMALLAVPLAVLLGAGLADVRVAGPRWAVALGQVAVLGWFVARSLGYSKLNAETPEINPYVVRIRLGEVQDLLGRVHPADRPVVMTTDMGGFMWWSDFELIDEWGLTDVPMANGMHHDQRRRVWRDDVLGLRRPHVIRMDPMRMRDLRMVDGYAEGWVSVDPETSVRRDLLFDARWTGEPGRTAVFPEGPVLEGLEARAREVAGGVFVEIGLRAPTRRPFDLQLVLVDPAGEAVASWSVSPGYGYYWPDAWAPDEVFHGRYVVELPSGVAPGEYGLGVRVTQGRAALVPERAADATTPSVEPELAWFPGLVTVTDAAAAGAAADADLERVRERAAAGACAEAEGLWLRAGAHLPLDPRWTRDHAAGVAGELAACWLGVAEGATGDARVEALVAARRAARPYLPPSLDPALADLPGLLEVDVPGLADALAEASAARYAAGRAAEAAGDGNAAFAAYLEAARIDPTNAWARRRAEDLRFAPR